MIKNIVSSFSIFILLSLHFILEIYNISINKYLFWFPQMFFTSLVKGVYVDQPRFSFIIYQIPSYILGFFTHNNFEYYYLRALILNIILSLFMFVIFGICYQLLKVSDYKKSIFSVLLIVYSLFFHLTSSILFNGSVQGLHFFLVVFTLQLIRLNTKKINQKRNFLELIFYILFYFSYPPFSFLGSIYFLLVEIMGKIFKKRFSKIAFVFVVGILISGLYLLFLEHPALEFLDKRYEETPEALGFLIKSYKFYGVLLLTIGLSFKVLNLKNHKTKYIIYFSFIFGVGLLLVDLLLNSNNMFMQNQYYFRVVLYTLSLAFLTCFSFSLLQKSRDEFERIKLSSIALVLLVLSFVFNLRSTFIYSSFSNDIKNTFKNEQMYMYGKNCLYPKLEKPIKNFLNPEIIHYGLMSNLNNFDTKKVLVNSDIIRTCREDKNGCNIIEYCRGNIEYNSALDFAVEENMYEFFTLPFDFTQIFDNK